MSESQSLLQTIAAWGSGGAAVVGSALLLRRRLSRDRTEMTKDRAESTFVENLVRDRDEAIGDARNAWATRTANTEAIARLTSENVGQAREITRLTLEFAAFKRLLVRLHPETIRLLGSDFGELVAVEKAEPIRLRVADLGD